MGSSPSPPTPSDPTQVATTQQGLNTTAAQQSQAGSMVNQYNPYGSLTYTQTGTSSNGTPMYSATTSLSPQQQQLLNLYTSGQTTAGGQANALLSGANYGSTDPASTIGNATQGLTGAAVQQQVAYLQPYFGQQTEQLDSQLRNQGLDPGSPAYKNAMMNLQNNQNNTVTGFVSQIEPQMYQQATSSYELPLTMASAELGMSSPTNPTFTNTPSLNIAPADYEGAVATAGQQAQQTYQDQLNQQNAMMSGLFGIGSATLGGWAKSGGLQSALGTLALA